MVTFQPFNKADLVQMPILTKLCFGRQTDEKFYLWKYFENPEGNVIGYTAKNDTGELVGFWGATPDSYYIQCQKKIIYHVCDTMTHPLYRRQGIFEKLVSLSCEELKKQNKLFLKVFPGQMAYPGYTKKLKWKDFGRIKPCFKLSLQLKIEQLFIKKSFNQFKDETTIVDAINNLDNKISIEFPIIKARDKAYLNWRIKDPSAPSRILYCYNNDQLVGYCIYHIEKNNLLLIKDIYSIEKKAYSELLTQINQIAIKGNLKGIYCWSNNKSFFSKLLKQHLFIKNPFNKGVMTYPLFFSILADTNIYSSNLIYEIKNWNLLPLDYDG